MKRKVLKIICVVIVLLIVVGMLFWNSKTKKEESKIMDNIHFGLKGCSEILGEMAALSEDYSVASKDIENEELKKKIKMKMRELRKEYSRLHYKNIDTQVAKLPNYWQHYVYTKLRTQPVLKDQWHIPFQQQYLPDMEYALDYYKAYKLMLDDVIYLYENTFTSLESRKGLIREYYVYYLVFNAGYERAIDNIHETNE